VQDLLLLARLEAGKDTITLASVRLDEVVLQVVARLNKLCTERKLALKTQFTSEKPGEELDVVVNGDEELLDSMIENFVENAIKYAPNGTDVELTLKVVDHAVELRIRDHGPGIPEEMRLKIFERFSRGKPSNEIPGSGLGLSIASEIARIHSVKIELSNPESGTGTVVRLTFPRMPA
jgi:signal transduction histidine kinase